jgi:hypothetical protein
VEHRLILLIHNKGRLFVVVISFSCLGDWVAFHFLSLSYDLCWVLFNGFPSFCHLLSFFFGGGGGVTKFMCKP